MTTRPGYPTSANTIISNFLKQKGSPNTAYSGEIFGAPESLGGGYETGNLRAINTGSMPGLHPQMPSGPYVSQMGFQPFHQLQPLNRYALGNALFRATSGMVNNGEPVYGDGLYGGAFGNHGSPVAVDAYENADLSINGQGGLNSRRKRSPQGWGQVQYDGNRASERKGRKGRRRRPAFKQASPGQTNENGQLVLGQLNRCPGKNAINLSLKVRPEK